LKISTRKKGGGLLTRKRGDEKQADFGEKVAK
jgi:hypothetical protein